MSCVSSSVSLVCGGDADVVVSQVYGVAACEGCKVGKMMKLPANGKPLKHCKTCNL